MSTRMWAKPAEPVAWVATTVHERAALTADTTTHAATDAIPCWCGATDVEPRGLNVLSSEAWTPGGIAYLIEWAAHFSKSTHQLTEEKTA